MLYALVLCVGTAGAPAPDLCQLAAQSSTSFFYEEKMCLEQARRSQQSRWWKADKQVVYSCEKLR
jgi:hypothetical protein